MIKMNKKGIDYAVLFLIVVIICMVALFFQLNKIRDSVGRTLGDAQAPVLHLNYDKNQLELFVTSSAEFSAAKALEKISGGFTASVATGAVAKGTELKLSDNSTKILDDNCNIINTPDLPREVKINPDFFSNFTTEFNKEMNKYLNKYNQLSRVKLPLDNYELYVEKDKLLGVALHPVIIPVKRTYSDVTLGSASWKPSFELSFTNVFDSYLKILDDLNSVANACSYQKDTFYCAIKNVITGWSVSSAGNNLYVFEIPTLWPPFKDCLALYLP